MGGSSQSSSLRTKSLSRSIILGKNIGSEEEGGREGGREGGWEGGRVLLLVVLVGVGEGGREERTVTAFLWKNPPATKGGRAQREEGRGGG